MLVLTRSTNQSIVIGHDVVVTVLEVRGDQVRIGIDAPREVQVHRMEVFQALQEANRQAADSAGKLDALSALIAGPSGAAATGGAGETPAPGPDPSGA